uniref:Movement protein n=1 Tax=Aristotelia chilensis virus 1 TaxID=1476980 RepID=X2G0D8_9VIRU|nr:movement protein [Aristotelia chilensis virus 1]
MTTPTEIPTVHLPPPVLSPTSSMLQPSRPSTSNLDSSLRKSHGHKLDHLYEITYLDDKDKVQITDLPILNPYHAFIKPQTSLTKSICSIISPSKSHVKEYVQSTRFDQCFLPASQKEQFVTLEIPSVYPSQWIAEGFTHLHFGAVRLALTFHGRKGLPISSRIALLDSRFLEYQHACIGTIETTLNAGTVFVTLFPNFNMPLKDPHLLTALKVQVQIVGATQVQETFGATLHYQLVYRVQNHALDLAVPKGTEDALLINVDSTHVPSCTHVPKQIPRSELVKIIPASWITNYENLHQAPQPVQATEPTFSKRSDGKIEISFEKKEEQSTVATVFPTMYQAEKIPISGFSSEGKPVYVFQDNTGHKYFDTCDCSSCYSTCSEYDDLPKKTSSQKELKQRFENGDSLVGLLGEPSGKFDYYVNYGTPPKEKKTITQPCNPPKKYQPPQNKSQPSLIPYYKKALKHFSLPSPPEFIPQEVAMFQPLTSEEFPPLEPFDDPQKHFHHKWKVSAPTTREPNGSTRAISQAEAVLNWQSQNAAQQNKYLQKIDGNQQRFERKLDGTHGPIITLREHIASLHKEILSLIHQQRPFISQEREINALKAQLEDITRRTAQQHQTPPSIYTDNPFGWSTSVTVPSFYPKISQPLSDDQKNFERLFGSTSMYFTPEEYAQKLNPPRKTKPGVKQVYVPKEKSKGIVISEPPKTEPTSAQLMVDNPLTQFLNKQTKLPEVFPAQIDSTTDFSDSTSSDFSSDSASSSISSDSENIFMNQSSSTSYQAPAPPEGTVEDPIEEDESEVQQNFPPPQFAGYQSPHPKAQKQATQE